MNWKDLLVSVEKPGRYIGGEVNALRRDPATCRLRFALAFPDAYEVGMSHLGLQILYSILGTRSDILVERCFAPWPDMERLLREAGVPLSSLESGIPLRDFDVVGFSLQYELCYTNVLNMLDLGGIPLRAADRRDGDPLVVAGGPCAFNPAPVSAFIDAFAVGEGEEVVSEIAEAVLEGRERGEGRRGLLERLAALEGVYVPVLPRAGRVRKRVVADLNRWSAPRRPVVPLVKAVHDRVNLEIARGCTRGCRFCQAGMVWRPVRERNPALLMDMAEEMLCATGHDELSLLSLSSGDYSRIEPLLEGLMARHYDDRVALALPSLRVETLTGNLIEQIRRVRKTSFTLAPEAGTQRLRNRINKGNAEEDLLRTASRVFEAGWRSMKLYFMIGLPGETQEDLEGIAELAYRTLGVAGKRGQVTVSLSTFVPKPHTPFQWEAQMSLEETLEKQKFFRGRIRNRNLPVKWHDARMSLLEGVFSRGDERLGDLLEEAFRLGCRFDGWSDRYRFDLWEEALRRTGIDPADCLRERGSGEVLPWDGIDAGVEREFLLEERERARREEATADCRTAGCTNCGACDHDVIRIVEAAEEALPASGRQEGERMPDAAIPVCYRMTFAKRGTSRFLSHLELSSALLRAMKQAGLAFVFSGGFHPHPKVSFASATAVGMESTAEYLEVQVQEKDPVLPSLPDRINAFLPAGLEITAAEEIPPFGWSLAEQVSGFSFRIAFPRETSPEEWDRLAGRAGEFLAAECFPVTREAKGKVTTRDVRPLVSRLLVDPAAFAVEADVAMGPAGSVRPLEILTQVLGIPKAEAARLPVLKTETFFR
ncbi:MAG: TIGR03960 family B12-binding radical SAM protein [Syntrophaceae bacterium]|nr:TIGR03960 family B12-binding radical SAM protein [Syntrophaceae bacterium]